MNNKFIISIIIILIIMAAFTAFMSYGRGMAKIIRDGNELYLQQDYEKARKVYEKGFSEEKEDRKLNYNLANTKYQLGDYQEAIELYQIAVDSPEKYLQIGNINYQLAERETNPENKIKQYQKAIESYKDGIIKYPENIELKYNYEYLKKI
ncbi:MAG: tetratricopeptide repeat protein, partial [Halanaerobiaceae bacterium]